ncbi:MAG: hypothetical protein RIG61_06900 [Deltaproteobacteria bacterium]
MTDNFSDEIKKIARSMGAGKGEDSQGSLPAGESDREFVTVLDRFFKISEEGVRIFNRESQGIRLSIHKLSPEFLDLFLDIPGRRGGFSIVSPFRIVIIFDEDPALITVIGKQRKTDGGKLSPAIQLIKTGFSVGTDGIEYRDNSGGRIEPREIVPLFIRWVSSS